MCRKVVKPDTFQAAVLGYLGQMANLLRHEQEVEIKTTEGDVADIRVIDAAGKVQSWEWARAKYGNLEIIPTPGDGYKVIQLVEITSGWMGFTCTVLNEGGGAVSGQRVAYKHGGTTDIEITNGAGVAEHSAGPGEKYDPTTAQGPVTWEVLDAASEQMVGIGWLSGTDHHHLQVTMRWNGGEEPEPPDDGDGDVAAAIDRLTAQFKDGITVRLTLG